MPHPESCDIGRLPESRVPKKPGGRSDAHEQAEVDQGSKVHFGEGRAVGELDVLSAEASR